MFQTASRSKPLSGVCFLELDVRMPHDAQQVTPPHATLTLLADKAEAGDRRARQVVRARFL